MTLIEACQQIAGVDSSVSQGTRGLFDIVNKVCEYNQLQCYEMHESVAGIENSNFICGFPEDVQKIKSGATEIKALLLVSTLDTSDPGEYSRWIKTGANPFRASLEGNVIYGLGLADAKADFICKLMSLGSAKVKSTSIIRPYVVGTFGRESGAGAIRIIRKKIFESEMALVGSPTELKLAHEGPGFAKVEISVPFTREEMKFKNDHDSRENSSSQSKIFVRPKEGIEYDIHDNPIFKCLEYLKKLPDGISIINIDGGTSSSSEPDSAALEVDLVEMGNSGVQKKLISIATLIQEFSASFKSILAPGFTPAHSTFTVGKIRTFPDEIKISGACRLVPADDYKRYDQWLEKLKEDCGSLGAGFKILDYKPPFRAPSSGRIMDLLKSTCVELGFNDKAVAAPHCTDANVFNRLGKNVVVFGPGSLPSKEKSFLESVKSEDLEKGRQFYVKIIERFCL